MRQHAWLLVSTITFICPSVNIGSIYLEPRSLIQEPESEKVFEMNKQTPAELGGDSMENKHFDIFSSILLNRNIIWDENLKDFKLHLKHHKMIRKKHKLGFARTWIVKIKARKYL